MANYKKSVDCGDPYQNLANAIVLEAVRDYREALRCYRRNGEENDEMRRCERFFRSAWYEMLTEVDGEYLIEQLRKEAGVE